MSLPHGIVHGLQSLVFFVIVVAHHRIVLIFVIPADAMSTQISCAVQYSQYNYAIAIRMQHENTAKF